MPNRELDQQPDLRVVHVKEGEPNHRNVWIFKGQGFVAKGMGRNLYERSDNIKHLYEEANEVLGYDIKTKCFEDPDGDLTKTIHAQPATLLSNQAHLVAFLEEGGRDFNHFPNYVAGNSLGEYSALIAANAIHFNDALRLIQKRAQFMQEAQDTNPGGLGTPLLSKKEEERQEQYAKVKDVIQTAHLEPCLINSRRQVVFGGTNRELETAGELFKERGIKFTRLKTDGAFHHPVLMRSAHDKLSPVIDQAKINDALFPVIANATGEPVQTAEEIKQALKDQMIMPVKWLKSMEYLQHEGFDTKYELGEKSSFLDMVLEHPVYDGIALTAIVAGGVTVAWKLTHPHHK